MTTAITTTAITSPDIVSRRRRFLGIAAFAYLSSTIVVMASERVYWYWSGFGVEGMLSIGLFYLIPTCVALWAMALVPARRARDVILVGALFAFTVEGVLTPIIYADGALPVLAFMFIGWHGLLAFGGFWYLARRWMLAGRTRLVAGASLLVGTLWGVWGVVSAVADPADIPDEIFQDGAALLQPGEFTIYALMVGATLALAHWLIGFVWPVGWRPTRRSTWIVAAVSVAYMAAAVLLIVPWAPIKLAAMFWITLKLLRASSSMSPDQPSLLDSMAGKVSARRVLPLMLMPLAAAAVYALTWNLSLGESMIGAVYWIMVIAQIVAGGIAFVVVAHRIRRQCRAEPLSAEPVPAGT